MVIAGINAADLAESNDMITSGRDLAWLQDPDDSTWSLYGAAQRDVFTLDADGFIRDRRNLTEHDLNNPAELEALQAVFEGL